MSIIALWTLVLFETVLLVLLLRVLGQLKQQSMFSNNPEQSSLAWGLSLGKQVPSFKAKDQTGSVFNMKDFQGRKRILVFISPGCIPCAETIEILNMFLQKEQEVMILAVGSTDEKQNRAFATEYHAMMPVLTPGTEVNDAYRVTVRPFAFALDENGIIRAKGPLNVREHLDTLLKTAFSFQLVSY